MPFYYFDVKNGRRRVDGQGAFCPDDAGAIARGKFIAVQLSIDAGDSDHAQHIVVINDAGDEIFKAPVLLRSV